MVTLSVAVAKADEPRRPSADVVAPPDASGGTFNPVVMAAESMKSRRDERGGAVVEPAPRRGWEQPSC